MGFLIFLSCCVFLVLDIGISIEFQNIAEKKGHAGSKYLWWSFFMGPVGWLMVIALPDRGGASAPVPTPTAVTAAPKFDNDELPDL